MGNCFQNEQGSANNAEEKKNSKGSGPQANQLTKQQMKNLKKMDATVTKEEGLREAQQKSVHRVLLLGPGSSGKTTVLNQMRKIHGIIRSEHSIEMVISVIRRNIVKYMALLCMKISDLGIRVEKEESVSHAEKVVQYAVADGQGGIGGGIDLNRGFNKMDIFNSSGSSKAMCPKDVLESIKFLWSSEPGIKKCLQNRSKFQIHDNVEYFFDSIDRAFDENFDPTDDDILRLRMRTSGFTETRFEIYFDQNSFSQSGLSMNNEDASSKLIIYNNNDDDNKNNGSNGNGKAHTKLRKETFIFIDVGGQRSERKKWMTVMKEDSQIQAVVYVVAISEFDMTCFEDNTTMRLDEALKLFEECGQNGILDDKTVTIFLNKFDLLTDKLQSIVNNTNPVQKDFKFYFNDFEGDGTDTTQILQYVEDLFSRSYINSVHKRNEKNKNNKNNKPYSKYKQDKNNSNNNNNNNNGNSNETPNSPSNNKNNRSTVEMDDKITDALTTYTKNGKIENEKNNSIGKNVKIVNNAGTEMERLPSNDDQSRTDVDTIVSQTSTAGGAGNIVHVSRLSFDRHSPQPSMSEDTQIENSNENEIKIKKKEALTTEELDKIKTSLFFHPTCALDTNQIRALMAHIQISLISSNLNDLFLTTI